MLSALADHNFRDAIVAGLRRREPALDIITLRSQGMATAPDPDVLALAANLERVLLTHDLRTMERFTYDRVGRGLPMPGVLFVPQRMPVGAAVEDLLVVLVASGPTDLTDRFLRLPL